MTPPTRDVSGVEVDAIKRRILHLDCGHRLFPGYGDPDGDVGAVLPCVMCEAEVDASRHVHIWRCPGYTATGNIFRCHPDAEPGGYCVGLDMWGPLNQRPLSLDELNEYARGLEFALARILANERRGRPCTVEPHTLPLTAESFLHPPHERDLPVLRALAAGTGRLLLLDLGGGRHRFVPEGASTPRLTRSDVLDLERAGLVRREAGTDRQTGPRVLTEHGRRCSG